MTPDFFTSWQKVVPKLSGVLRSMEEKTIIGFGMIPYPRIIPALFLRNYIIYSVKDTADIDLLRSYANIFCLEEKFPKAAQKIHAASYLLGNYAFQAFLKSRRYPFRLMLHRTTPAIVQKLEDQHIEWIGNRPESFEDLLLPTDFANVMKKLGLPYFEISRLPREEFLTKNFDDFYDLWQRPFLIQRVYSETGVEQNPFQIKDTDDWEEMFSALSGDAEYKEVQVSLF